MVKDLALEVFGNRFRSEIWFQTGSDSFKGAPPLYFLNSPKGIVKVILELGRLNRIKKDAQKAGLAIDIALADENAYFQEPFCALATESE